MDFYVCRCFYNRNIFLKGLNIHVEYLNKQQFFNLYGKILQERGVSSERQKEEVVREIEKEITRRLRLGDEFLRRKHVIDTTYTRLHPDIYNIQKKYLCEEFLSLVEYCKHEDATFEGMFDYIKDTNSERAYSFPVFTAEFCVQFLEEIKHFESSSCPKGRPNTMNRYGVLLDELGFDKFMTELREHYLRTITGLLYPDWGGGHLDSHKAFIVQYQHGHDLDLSYHYDNAEVTLNVALSPSGSFTGGELYFGTMRTDTTDTDRRTNYEHVPTVGLLHRGQHKHGARPITSGSRYNLIIWMRSSVIRNQNCPMCDRVPELVKTVGFGDGFTKQEPDPVNVCSLY